MLRPLLVLAIVAGTAHAAKLPGGMGMYPTSAGPPLAMLDSNVTATVRGPIVEVVVVQRFRNDTDRVTEATYIFPMPADAAVSAMAMTIGTRTIHASIAKRAEAQQRYEDAVAAGLGAGLLDQERPDVFTQTVSAIPARGVVEVTLRFDTTASYRGGTWELVLPMVVAPRYVPGSATGRPTTGAGRTPDTDRTPDASRVTPGGRPGAGGKTAVAIHFTDSVDGVTSPTHDLGGADKSYAFEDARSDHDAIVRWQAHAHFAGWVEQDSDGGYAAVIVEAPAPPPHKGATNVLLVLDRAATMRGDADAVEHPLVNALLTRLDMADRVAVTGSDHVTPSAPGDARHALDQSWAKAAGPFDLTRVLQNLQPAGATVLLVADGLVADDAAAIAAAVKTGAAIHVIGVGPAPNRSLLIAIANRTGGTIRFAAPGDDLGALAGDVASDLASPPASLAVNWGTLAASEVVPGNLPRLGTGQALLVTARVKRAQPANGRARGEVFAIAELPATPAVAGAVTPRGALARRWARARLDELLAGKPDVAAITAHALRYGLVSPYTSMVAIGDQVMVEGGVKHTVAVPVSVPEGMRWQEVKRETTIDDKNKDINDRRESDKPTKKKPSDPVATKAPQPTVVMPPTAPKTKEHKPSPDYDDDGKDAGDDDQDHSEQPKAKHRKFAKDEDVAAAPPPNADALFESGDALMVVQGMSEEMLVTRARALRLAASLGGGLAIEHGTDALVAAAGRLEYGNLTLVGVDAALWLVGEHAQGYALATLARRGIARHFELGVGFGLHLGGELGPAGALSLRYAPRETGPAGYLRFDGALLDKFESALTLGVEWRW